MQRKLGEIERVESSGSIRITFQHFSNKVSEWGKGERDEQGQNRKYILYNHCGARTTRDIEG